MAEESYLDFVNPTEKVPNSDQLDELMRVGQHLGIGDNFKQMAEGQAFEIQFRPETDPNNSTVNSHAWLVPFPCRLVYADMNVRNLNGATATGDIMVNRAAAGYVSQLDAAEALVVDTQTRVAPETTAISSTTGGGLLAGDLVIFRVIGTGAGAIIAAHLRAFLTRK